MSALVSTVTRKGQVTIPKDVRDSLNLVSGDKVEFIRNAQGEVIIQPVTRKVIEVAGILSKYKKTKPVSIEAMDEAIAQHIRAENTL
jgi:AbrB family looped-hinge helix DNA binding protein